jgi:hypothetical protein
MELTLDNKPTTMKESLPQQRDRHEPVLKPASAPAPEPTKIEPTTKYISSEMFASLPLPSNEQPILLDPLSVIVQLAILSYKPIGTKICIYKNAVYIQDVGFFQSTVRLFHGDNKYNLQYLYNPIELACKTYLTSVYITALPTISVLFQFAIQGLTVLNQTYQGEHVTYSLILYKAIIENYLTGLKHPHVFNSHLFVPDHYTSLYSSTILNQYYHIWSSQDNNKIKLILNIINYLENESKSTTANVETIQNIKCLQEIMYMMNAKFNDVCHPCSSASSTTTTTSDPERAPLQTFPTK